MENKCLLVPLTICCLLIAGAKSEDALLVIGGQYFNTSTREHEVLATAELITEDKTCQIGSLPVPLYGLTGVRLRNSVLVCGGYYYYYRRECYEYMAGSREWRLSRINLPRPAAFPNIMGDGDTVYLAGGRNYVPNRGGESEWQFENSLLKLEGSRWTKVLDLPEPIGDLCGLITNHDNVKRLWLFGGSNYPQRYKSEVYRLDLDSRYSNWTRMPDMLDRRMWHGCSMTALDGDLGILIVGGYYNGNSNMWLPLTDRYGRSLETFGTDQNMPRWTYESSLNSNRKWGPSIGFVGDHLTAAGGKDYGDETIEILRDGFWTALSFNMINKREFAAGVTVPRSWFAECNP